MISLNCLSINRPQILASALPSNSFPSLPHHPSSKPSNPSAETVTTVKPSPPLPSLQQPKQKQRPRRRQPSLLEIERAIGAGIFRDRDPDSEEKLTLFDKVFLKSIRRTEGSVEKQLRETGEWISERSEKTFRSAGDTGNAAIKHVKGSFESMDEDALEQNLPAHKDITGGAEDDKLMILELSIR